ncbi:uncharacterized protein LOC130589820 [Beta vulgaris subsp. vulgaris]|uniref:uncharacterized protein LOC130589820 n=1 Tax=Beta vulgaris subsp. vulgaris TaxID=3555 RepID=UPI0025498B3D|nr:uncharacterized protein LOC130589820 [Beta vulgaris subsp. vulgaris]
MKICEVLQANVLLEKFPPSWREFRNNLKHRKEFLSLQELISHMRIEEANRIKDNQDSVLVNVTKANLVESAVASSGSDKFEGKGKKVINKGKKQGKFNKPNGKIQKRTVLCYVCGFCDASWVSGNDEISSTSGYVFTLGGSGSLRSRLV